MTEEHLVSLIARQFTGDLLPEEGKELLEWAGQGEPNRAFLARMSNRAGLEHELALWKQLDPASGYRRWADAYGSGRRKRMLRIIGWTAASVLTAAVVIGLVKMRTTSIPARAIVATIAQPVLPGRNTATLTLANGQKLLLDSVGKGELSVQGNSRVIKPDSGKLSYITAGAASKVVAYNVLTTPRAGQYEVVLPDGSRVWLNNVSSLRYPTSFQGRERTVEVMGEAYFEIAQNPAKPFFVKVGNQTIEVLGTSFNVMAYSDENTIQTTLLTGALKVKTSISEVRLKPDEQAQTTDGGELKIVKDVSSEDIISWKDGFFYFGRASFATVMRQLARWYDVDVVYEGAVPDVEFGGKIDRSLPLNDLLKFLDKNQIHFRLEGRKLIVLPN